jgi:2-keto-4-pentenoate hydratase
MIDKIEAGARILAQAWTERTTVPLLADAVRPSTRAEAYSMQDRMASILGDRRLGWKLGAAARAAQIADGHDGPIPGRILASRTFDSPASAPASLFNRPKAECELAFRLTRRFAPQEGRYDAETVAQGLTFLPGIEIGDTRYDLAASARPRNTYDDIADNGSCGGFVAGPEIADWRAIDFGAIAVDAASDGGAPAPAVAPESRRDPFDVAVEMINAIVARGHALEAGDYLTTGSLVAPQDLVKGQRFRAAFGPYGMVELTLT